MYRGKPESFNGTEALGTEQRISHGNRVSITIAVAGDASGRQVEDASPHSY